MSTRRGFLGSVFGAGLFASVRALSAHGIRSAMSPERDNRGGPKDKLAPQQAHSFSQDRIRRRTGARPSHLSPSTVRKILWFLATRTLQARARSEVN